MTVQDYLCGEWRMTADLDRDVAPLGIEDLKRIVIYVGHGLLSLDVMVGSDVPHRRLRAADQDQKQTLRDLRFFEVRRD